MRYISIFLLLSTNLFSMENDLIQEVAMKYQRAITILYISDNPKWINAREDDIVVYWTTNEEFSREIETNQPKNCVLLSTKILPHKMKLFTECDHFDIGIIETNLESNYFSSTCHLAEHTFVNSQYIHKPKTSVIQKHHLFKALEQNYKGYEIRSTNSEKLFCSTQSTHPWLPGISFYFFLLLKGTYPAESVIAAQIYDHFDILIHRDYTVRNLVVQGEILKSIDYDPNHIIPLKKSEKKALDQLNARKQKLLFYSYLL